MNPQQAGKIAEIGRAMENHADTVLREWYPALHPEQYTEQGRQRRRDIYWSAARSYILQVLGSVDKAREFMAEWDEFTSSIVESRAAAAECYFRYGD